LHLNTQVKPHRIRQRRAIDVARVGQVNDRAGGRLARMR
jgi:hypothetical protein